MRRIGFWLRAGLLFVVGSVSAAANDTAAALKSLLDGAKASHSDSMLIVRDGKVLADYRRPGTAPHPIELMSVTKSVVALAIGRLIGTGKIASLDTPVYVWFPEWRQGRKEQITLRMLLNHTSGLQDLSTTAKEIYPAPDFVQLALAAELVADPGARFFYSNKAVNLLAGIVERSSGMKLDDYLQHELFAPMQIEIGGWERDKAGNPEAFAGLEMTAGDLAKLGQLVLDEGRWQGTQLIPPSFVREMLSPGSKQSDEAGLLWWRWPAWVRLHVDAGSFEMLRSAGLPEQFIAKLKPWNGRSFDQPGKMLNELFGTLGADGKEAWLHSVQAKGYGPYRIFNFKQGPVAAYAGEGDLGQYIIIVPAARVMAIRQIEYSDAHQEFEDYDDFLDRVMALSKTFAPNLGGNDQAK